MGWRFAMFSTLSGLLMAAGCGEQPAQVSEPRPARKQAPTVVPEPAPETPVRETPKPKGILPSFRTIGRESGLDFERYDDFQGQWRILEVNGGGVALFDFDRDGRLDVFFTNGCRLPLKERDRTRQCELFRNLPAGDGAPLRFGRVTQAARLEQFGSTHGCAVGDIDSDGFDDLYVTALGDNGLWANNGDGTFSDITEATRTQAPGWSSSAAFADLNRDGHLDLYVANYVDESDESPKLCPNPASPDGYLSCPPAQYQGVDDVLFLSDGAGGFIDATASAGVAGLKGKGLGVVIVDLDRDGRQEIFVANDGEPNFLLVETDAPESAAKPSASDEGAPGSSAPSHPRAVHYEDRALQSGVALSESGYAQANMGIASGDYDANGETDLFITHFYNDTSTLYANRGELAFEDATRRSKVGAPSRRALGWGTCFVDVDNDSWLDLFATNGHVDDRTWQGRGEPYRMRPLIYRNEHDGTFSVVTPWSGDYFTKEWIGRGAAMGDLDRDGSVDLAVSHQRDPSVALVNETPGDKKSLTLQFVGIDGNRNGYGVRVEVLDPESKVLRELVGGGSYQSASALELHLGLGDESRASLRVVWPSGRVETHAEVSAGRWILQEGSPPRESPDLGVH